MNLAPTRSERKRPYLIGIAGPTCSGKSTLAHALADALAPAGGALTITMDCYYRDLSHLDAEQRARSNFDSPDALESDLLVAHLRTLRHGQPILRPSYNFVTHCREPWSHRLDPQPFIIVEGLFTFFWEDMRALIDRKVFVELSAAECLARRLKRDTTQRGRSKTSVLRQYNETVRPMYERFCGSTVRFADVGLKGVDPTGTMVARVLASLEYDRMEHAGADADR